MAHPISRKNPYIIGRAIDEPTLLFGRENLFSFLEANLRQSVKISLLHGQRRIGKTSIIHNIPKLIKLDKFVFISFDLEYYSSEDTCEILLALAQEIFEQLQLDNSKITLPNIKDLQQDIYVFHNRFLWQVFTAIKSKNIVILFDEFDSLIPDSHKSNIQSFLNLLKSIIEQDNRLFLIICAGRQTKDKPNIFNVFPDISDYEIGLLNQENTEKLITEPAKNILKYNSEAINKIFELSAGHPYFIQTICFAIFVRARELGKWQVKLQDVDKIIDKAIEYAEAGLTWFWDGLTITEKIVFSAVAEFQNLAIEKKQMPMATPFKLLQERYEVPIAPEIKKANLELIKSNFLNQSGNKIIIELVRLWLLERHPLSQQIKSLEKNNFDNENDFNRQYTNIDSSEKKDSNNSYVHHTALAIPSFFSVEKFSHSLQTKKSEIKLSNNHNLLESESQYSYGDAQGYIIPTANLIVKKNLSQKIRFPLLTFLVLLAPILAIIGANRFFQSCSLGEKSFIGICVPNPTVNISNGNRTFFLIKGNSNRDEGIKAFKQGNYQKSIQLFKQALEANPKDSEILPEVRIYYNNALARQKGNPLALAVVLPVDNKPNIALEILRGVAQAQDEFNQKGGLNNRFLEIFIVDDSGKPEAVKEVTAELIKNDSILGVIGHFSDNTTESALEEYKKAKIPVISLTSNGLSPQTDLFFRILPSDAATSKKLAEYAFNNLLVKNIVIFSNHNSSYSESIRKEFTKIFEEIGGKVVYQPPIDFTNSFNQEDAKEEVKKSVFKYKAQAALLIMDAQDTDVALKISQANYDLMNDNSNQDRRELKLLGTDTLYSERILSASRENVEGLIVAVPWFREYSKAKEFAEKAAIKWEGKISWRTATSFDATQAFIQALSKSENPTRSTIVEDLENVKLAADETSGDIFEFNSQRERIIEPVLVRVKKDEFTPVFNE